MVSILQDDDFGFVITITFINRVTGLAEDVSGATTQRMDIKDIETGTVLQRTSTYVTDGTDGKIQYTTAATEFNTPGRWELQGIVITASAAFHTEVAKVDVRKNVAA